MLPAPLHVLGREISVWNLVLVFGIVLGYAVLRLALRLRRPPRAPRWLALRWLLTVYGAMLGAQLFSYLFDANTSALPPPSIGLARYYLDPFFGPKTLYGAIVFLPVTAAAATLPWRDLEYGPALDCWTPAMFAVLGTARVGCFLQGCCYGIRSSLLGVSFPPYGALYQSQLDEGLIAPGSWTVPVVPTQLIEAVALFALCGTSLQLLRRDHQGIFLPFVVAYSLFRFGLEIVRADPDRNFLGPLSTSQWIAVAVIVASLATYRTVRA